MQGCRRFTSEAATRKTHASFAVWLQEREYQHRRLVMDDHDLTRFIFPIPPGIKALANSSDVAILGPTETHKTSLLLQAAIGILTQNPDSTVTFISTKVMTRVPTHIHLMSKFNIEVGKRLFIYYIYSTDELIKFIQQYHTKSSFPIAFMIDDLQEFITNDFCESLQQMSTTEVLSMILRNVHYLASEFRSKSGKPCYVFISSQEQRRTIMPFLDSSDDRIDSPDKPADSEVETGIIKAALSFNCSCILNLAPDKLMRDTFILSNEMNSTALEFNFTDNELYLKSVYEIVSEIKEI